ncbi:heme-binding protein 1-like isoform X1 [Colius striatus]|uniref:heme-binding protein 1-like isoform X1 n=1 Tax=Colius striatus TaxID=57412 RepID=UPI002B1E3431|nr:heme-binding protein 1-like isoform X1 [Colius striatus]
MWAGKSHSEPTHRAVLSTPAEFLSLLPPFASCYGRRIQEEFCPNLHSPSGCWSSSARLFPPAGQEAFCLLSSVHEALQGKGTAPENDINPPGGLWVPGIRNILCEGAAYEERQYPAGKWACVTKGEPMYEQSISMSFMKLMRYICKENSVGCYLGMTVPVLNEIHLTEEGTELEREVVTAYYLPGEFQQNPPVPADPDIHITERAPLRVITRVFYGMTTEETILREISLFWELLGSTDTVLRRTYVVAAYQNPSVPQRRNEIWFICRAE